MRKYEFRFKESNSLYPNGFMILLVCYSPGLVLLRLFYWLQALSGGWFLPLLIINKVIVFVLFMFMCPHLFWRNHAI